MDLCNMNDIKSLLTRHGFHFSKSMGQNFLIDPEVPARIAASSEADRSCGVLEIGPGIGPLTAELAQLAGKVVSVERDAQHFRFISQIVDTLKAPNCYLLRADVFRYLDRCNEQFDFIFADPPYALKNLEDLPDLVFRHNLLKPDGLFVLEHGKTNDFSAHPSFKEHRTYGSVNFSFFKAKETANE